MNSTLTETLVVETCCNCGVQFAMTSTLHNKFKKEHTSFYCPSGHGQFYPAKSDVDKLKEQLQEVKNQLDKVETEKLQLNTKLNGTLDRLDKVNKGLCPVCGKPIANNNLKRHMNSKRCKHPSNK
jgi:RNA polymerase-binding transcription factor DksA